ncbi:MAG: DUF1294 domain-containing protein [Planctomycetota bacterium]
MMKKPVRTFFSATFALALGGAAAIRIYTPISDLLLAWIISITVIAFLTYGYDKAVAGKGRTRVPERVLLCLAFSGGTVGAVLGMFLFRHKTVKTGFRLNFLALMILQTALIVLYFFYLKPRYLN